MTSRRPDSGWADVPPEWSREVEALDTDGERRTWHVLDTHARRAVPAGTPTLVCVHGNPTWSYLWRRFLAAAPDGWRVVAIDHLGMGWSDRLSGARTLAMRVDDLDTVAAALGIQAGGGKIVLLAHDWGGPISLGWALRLVQRDDGERLGGIVLGNTAVHQPTTSAAPALIRIARTRSIRSLVTQTTPIFVLGTTALSRRALPRSIRDGLAAPYRSAVRRRAIGDFVADIPFESDHPSRATLDAIADGLTQLADVPVLVLWGARDPVFTERHLADLLARLPHADVQRYARASHLVTEDVPATVEHAWSWIGALDQPRPIVEVVGGISRTPTAAPDVSGRPLWSVLDDRSGATSLAVLELGRGSTRRAVSFGALAQRVKDLACGLIAIGVRPGDRIGLLIPPGIDLTAVVYASWRAGAVIVVSDAGLGLGSLGDALRSAAPDHVIAIAPGLVAAKLLRIPGRRILIGSLPAVARRALGVDMDVDEIERLGRSAPAGAAPTADLPTGSDEAAVLFTSGATGPPKGVVYRFDQLDQQLAQVRSLCRLGSEDRLVAAFAPFALYGPALGIGAAVPAMDVTKPGTLTARALADAIDAIQASVVFASPAALRNVVATAAALDPAGRAALGRVRMVLSAGAPVGVELLSAVQQVLPNAELHTPYGMTEAMPVADTTLGEIVGAGAGNGVLVGSPRPGVEVAVAPLHADGSTSEQLSTEPGLTGEICVRASHVKERYDKLWAVEAQSSRTAGWHRTGDVGQLDEQGRLWVEGRLAHIIVTAAGPRTPVAAEQALERLEGVEAAALVGVGPAGTQQVIAVLVPTADLPRRSAVAPAELAERSRAAVGSATGIEFSAVLVTEQLPTDVRHNSKVDRARVARWAERVLSGGRVGRP